MTKSVVFVCLGNICRSPTAEAILRSMAPEWDCDSAGTGAWHVGQPPDRRMQQAAGAKGYDMSALRARQFTAQDFARFEHIIVMDNANQRAVEALRPKGNATPVRLLLDYGDSSLTDVPDPYYEGGFDTVVSLIEAAIAVFLQSHGHGASKS